MLEDNGVFTGLPVELGAMKLEEVALPEVTLIAPFKGQMMLVADALKENIGLILPPAGQYRASARAGAYWRSPGQWLVFGALDTGALKGMAAVVDMSDAFGRLRLTGGREALARLVEVDLEAMPPGQVAHTALVDIGISVIVTGDGFELMLPRSYAASAVGRIETAMRGVVARRLVE